VFTSKTLICREKSKKIGRIRLSNILLEVACPKHGFERFSIKVVKRYNIPSKDIRAHFRKLKYDEITQLYVGRKVTNKEIKKFVNDYLSRVGMREMILKMKFVKIT